jgi:hypothetical protein
MEKPGLAFGAGDAVRHHAAAMPKRRGRRRDVALVWCGAPREGQEIVHHGDGDGESVRIDLPLVGVGQAGELDTSDLLFLFHPQAWYTMLRGGAQMSQPLAHSAGPGAIPAG